MTVLQRWDIKNAASALDPNNGSTAAVPNIPDPIAFEQQVSSTLVDLYTANPSRHKNARAAGLKPISFIVAPTMPAGQSFMYPRFFAFRVRENFQGYLIFRHFDRRMGFQVNLTRLLNFDIDIRNSATRTVQFMYFCARQVCWPAKGIHCTW
jgi:Acetyl-CoA carboxylase, central region